MLISVCCQIWFLIVYSSFNTNEHHTDVLPLSLSDCTTQRMSVFGLSSSVVTLFNSLCHWMCWSVNDCTLSPPGGGSLYEWAPPIQVWCCQVGWSWLCTGQAVDDFFFTLEINTFFDLFFLVVIEFVIYCFLVLWVLIC